ncbi:hypothetical protein CGL57_18225 [Edwardsiella anguillarum]|nr:hypothetical protein QY76_16220 [Edwardsiella sp. EA181011]RFS99785.1 hypothetical protein CGL57_18225 [Edwardsiella anguillarum]
MSPLGPLSRFNERGSTDNVMCVHINGQMQFPPDAITLFARLLNFPLTVTEDLQHGGINYPMRNLTSAGRCKTDVNLPDTFTDTTVIRAVQWDVQQGKMDQ